jgi:hypothetical protein
MATKKVEHYTGTRITFHSTQPFSTIMTKLYASIGPVENITAWSGIAKGITSYSAENREKFIAVTENQVGPHGFMIFQVPPSSQLPSPSPDSPKVTIVYGNDTGVQPRRMGAAI